MTGRMWPMPHARCCASRRMFLSKTSAIALPGGPAVWRATLPSHACAPERDETPPHGTGPKRSAQTPEYLTTRGSLTWPRSAIWSPPSAAAAPSQSLRLASIARPRAQPTGRMGWPATSHPVPSSRRLLQTVTKEFSGDAHIAAAFVTSGFPAAVRRAEGRADRGFLLRIPVSFPHCRTRGRRGSASPGRRTASRLTAGTGERWWLRWRRPGSRPG